MDERLVESYNFCRDLSSKEAKNFYWSFRLLPPERRRSMCALYAFMRRTDDIADDPGDPGVKRDALNAWRDSLHRAIAGGTDEWPGLAALGDSVRRYSIPSKHLEDVIDGVEMDLESRTFATFDDLYPYCYRVASAVGLACIHLWGFRSDGGRAESMAEACGIALQLTNIIRDVREDALNGRVYLPQEDLARFGVTREDFVAESPSHQLRELLAFEATRAREFYDRSKALDGLVFRSGRPVLRAISGIYRALLDEIVDRDYDVLSRRVSLPSWRKAWIAARSLVRS